MSSTPIETARSSDDEPRPAPGSPFAARVLTRVVGRARAFVARRELLARVAQRLLDRVPPLQDAFVRALQGNPDTLYQRWVERYDTLDESDLDAIRREGARLADPPLFVVLVPLAGAAEPELDALASSLLAQVYERWEAQFAGEIADEGAAAAVARWVAHDARFRMHEPGRSTTDALNSALRTAAGEDVVLSRPGVVLRPHSLFLVASELARHPDAALIYGDADVVDESGARSDHYFKPDWNQRLLRAQNYLGELVYFRRARAAAVGGFRSEPEDDGDWDFFLRLTAGAPEATVRHIPFVLSHRLARPRAAAEVRERVARAHERRLERTGSPARVEPIGEHSYRVRVGEPPEGPRVTVVVPTTCDVDVLRPCVDGLLTGTRYPSFELVLVVGGGAKTADQRAYLDDVGAHESVRVLPYDERPYNFSRTNNWAVERTEGDLVCFLNDDTAAAGPGWLGAMVAELRDERVAAVGAMLVYPNGRIQHAGIVLGAGGVAALAYRGSRVGTPGYHDRALVAQDVSCVTAACMLVRRDAFLSVGGFDPSLAVAYNDVDLCLRLRAAGRRIVWTPDAELYHRESTSFGRHDAGETRTQWLTESHLMQTRWGAELRSDPHYNPSLSLDALQLWTPAFPPRAAYSWRAAPSDEAVPVSGAA